MKTTLTTLALILAASTASATSIAGCEVVDKGGYFNKADPTCAFSNTLPGSRTYGEGEASDGGVVFVADDLDPTTDLTVTVSDN